MSPLMITLLITATALVIFGPLGLLTFFVLIFILG
jgi:hypothetical protein